MPKVIDLPTATTMDDSDYLLMEESTGGTKKITKFNAVSRELSFNTVGVATVSDLDAAVTNGSSSLYFSADVAVGGVTVPRYSRGMSLNARNSADGVFIAVDPSRNIYHGFRNGTTWNVRTDKTTAVSGVVTRTSGGTVSASTVRTSDRFAHLYIAITSVATAAGSNVFDGSIDSAYRPAQDALGIGYVGGSALVAVLRQAGTITVRVIGAALPANATFAVTIPYILP